MTFVRPLTGLLVIAGVLSDTLAEDNELVGRSGDFSRLEIQGLASFTAEKVRDALREDFDALLAAHPLAPSSDLPAMVCERLHAGFLNEGFAEAEVEVRLEREDQRLRAVVREGARYVAGSVRVEGAAKVPVDRLIARLTKPYPPREAVKMAFGPGDAEDVQWKDRDGKDVKLESPVWKLGDPARLAPTTKEWTARKVKLALEDIGFRFAKFHINMVPDSASRTADLVVHLEDEGPEASLDDIEILGNKRNSREAILKYLNLKKGAVLTRTEQTRIEYELWQSGRFTEYELIPVSPDSPDDPVKLRIKVTESPFAPPIDKPLSREEQVLLRMREWLANPDRWQGDLTLQLKNTDSTIEVIMAPARGALATFSSPTAGPKWPLTIVASKDVVGYFPADVPSKLEGATPEAEFESTINIILDAEPEDPQKPFRLNIGFGAHSKSASDSKGPIVGAINLQPAAAIATVHASNAKTKWDGETLIVTRGLRTTYIDASSGAVLRFRAEDGEDVTEITFRQGAFDQGLTKIRKHSDGLENCFVSERPVSSILAFFCREEVISDLANNLAPFVKSKPTANQHEDLKSLLKTLKLARKLLDVGVLKPVDDLFTEPKSERDAEFDIPTNFSPSDEQVNFAAIFARLAVTIADDLFPRDSWLWTVWREAGFTVAGKGKYTGPQLQVFYESCDFGPVCYLTIGALLEKVQPHMSRLFALRGLLSTDAEDFSKDYEPLLDRRFVIGACLRRTAEVLRKLEDDEIEELAIALPNDYRPCFLAFARELRSDDERAIDLAIPVALSQCWQAGLKQAVESQLRGLRDRNSSRVGMR